LNNWQGGQGKLAHRNQGGRFDASLFLH